jgi:gliding motility-associated-like protein
MRKYIYLLILTVLFFSTTCNIYATHLRAGDITARVINQQTRTYEFTLTLYRDTGPGSVDQPDADLNFGDGSPCQNSKVESREQVGPQTEKLIYRFTHSFAGDGQYTISFNEENRNENINNIADGNSVNISFYVETKLILDAFNGKNSTPVLLVPPIDRAARGKLYLHNPGAFDPDGDSLAYRLEVSKAFLVGEDGCGSGTAFTVPNYKLPNDAAFGGLNTEGGAATFTLNPISGDLVWNTPGREGEYNMAFVVEEWRKINGEWVLLGYVTRDMQVTVQDTDNNPPELIVPKDTCVEAGTLLTEVIKATDIDGDQVYLSSYSGLYTLANSPATFTGGTNHEPKNPKDTVVKETFTWQTNCSHVRVKPYQVIFQAKDAPGNTLAIPPLVDVQVWNITVVAPAPKELAAQPGDGKEIDLTWKLYDECPNAEKILIYRREGPYDFTPEHCQVGIPEGAGYELVGSVNANEASFTDNQNLKKGVQYCYRIVAQFRAPGGGVSYASAEACTILKIDVPVITNVTVDSTSTDKGVITVKWLPPLELDTDAFKGPYKYELYRSTGLTSTIDAELVYSTNDFNATSFVDRNLNTDRNPYTYQILFYFESTKLLDSSSAASSVRLSAAGGVNSIDLTWTAETPWVNTTYTIFRQNKDTQLFDSIGTSTEPAFIDDGKLGLELIPEQEYCYRIKAYGSYNNPLIPSPLINYSQIACQSPKDSIPPCAPILTISPKNCEEFVANANCGTDTYFNTLSWTDVNEEGCKADIAYYNVYYAFSTDSTNFQLIASNITGTSYQHKNNPYFFAGCYAITAVDRSGNESGYSNVICNDNCPYLELPNAFSPNGDGKNEVFKPFDIENGDPERCARFVESIEIIIVNRWGNVVYDSKKANNSQEVTKFINWDGKTNSGKELATGTYFYTAKVKFITLDPKKANQTFKGWVQIFR